MKNDALKKHHFWILAGVAPFLTLLAIIFLMSGVGDAISAQAEAIDKGEKEAKGTQPKGKKALDEDYPRQKKVLLEQREKLWKANYERQKELFTWPSHPRLQPLAARYTKFGEEIQTPNQEFEVFVRKDVYEAAYDQVAASIRPTTFPPNGGWRRVLRYVSDWGEKYPESRQIWLALEDFWVQKTLLQPITAVNAEAARFELVSQTDPKTGKPIDSPLHRTFRSRIWELELQVPTEGPSANKVILAKLRNRTDRLQLLGNGKQMRLRIWLSELAQPILYRIEGEYVRAGETIEVRLTPPDKPDPKQPFAVASPLLHGIPPGTEVEKIAKVEQILDERTVPIRQVLNIELGYKDARHAPAPLKKPEKWWKEPDPATTGAGGDASGMMGPPGVPGPGPMGALGPMGVPGPPGAMGGPGMTQTRAKTGPPQAVLDANRERYVEATDQVRRMPVAVVLLVDQMFVQDTLVAYANSPLRCQITQYHWNRFRGSASSLGSAGDFIPPGADPSGQDFGSDAGGYTLPGPMAGPRGFSPGPMGGGDFGPGYPGMGSSSSSVVEGQATSGLVELTIYGIVTLYEKYEQKAEEGTPGTEPMATEPTNTPQPMTPMATEPSPEVGKSEPKEPKEPKGTDQPGTPAPMPPMPAPTGTPMPPGTPAPPTPPKM